MAGKCNFLYKRIMLLAVCLDTAKMDERQQCSSFSYERSTLEKMIRMEIKVEGMEKEMKKYSDLIDDTEERTKTAQEMLKTKSEEMDEDMNEKQAQIQRMSQDLIDIRNRTMNDLKHFSATPLVAFRAINIADKSPATDQTLVFPTAVLNEGQGYNTVTGQFTAPTDGLYHLSVQLCSTTSGYMYYDIVVDNVIVNSGTFYENSQTTCGSADTSVVIRRNMKAWVKCASGYPSSDFIVQGRNYMNIFSGFLVHKM